MSTYCRKGRVAPLKAHSICRLELMGALIGARLAETVVKELTIEINAVVFWSDSTTVLHWIKQISSSYKAFVGNRVSEIHSVVHELETKLGADTVTWRYVPTDVNPADDISRGLSPSELTMGHRYLSGPEFLKTERENWPKNKVNPPSERDTEERKETKWTGTFQEKTPLISWNRFSCLGKLRRVMAYVLRFVTNLRKKTDARMFGHLSIGELNVAHDFLVKKAQSESFEEELKVLQKGSDVSKRSRLKAFDPRIERGFLVVGGRINRAAIPYKSRHPVILDPKHHLTHLIIDEMHREYHHPPTEHLLNLIRQKYWVIHGRQMVRNRKFKCGYCRRQSVKPHVQKMGNLPACRLEAGVVFQNTGVDFFGPMFVKEKRSTLKVYGCLFVCMATRACHLELVDDLSTDHFLMALKRFMARRGRPKRIYSDNGTNFVGADNELRACLTQLDHVPRESP